MKIGYTSLLTFTLFLVACTSNNTASETDVATLPSFEATASENSQQAEVNREAVLSEIENDVKVKKELSSEFTSATVGIIIPLGGVIETGDNSRAKLNLTPENTIIRVGPNSSFTLSKINNEDGEPKTTLQLLFGKVFILLNGGSLEVETPSGVASVRGSLLSVQYDPESSRVRASCLEGECTLENVSGEEVEMTEGESIFIDEEGNLSELTEIDQDEIEDWLEENPELDEFMEELPEPESYPDFEDDEWYEDEEAKEAETEEESVDAEEVGEEESDE